MALSLAYIVALSAAAGVLSHVGYFIHGERMLIAPSLVVAAITGPPIIVGLTRTLTSLSLYDAVQLTFVGYGAYLTALFTSMLIYRVFFHPLRHFPGPKAARLSQFYHFFRVRAKVDNYKHLDRLHDQYGEFVRVGPNLLSISDPAMIDIMFNHQSNFEKADCWCPIVVFCNMSSSIGGC
jgi:hypothetical protein